MWSRCIFHIGFALPAGLFACALVLGSGAAHAFDLDGNGVSDLLFRDRSQGDHRLEIVLNDRSGPFARRSLLLATGDDPDLAFDVRSGDFDGDGRSDILTRSLRTGSLRVRLMDGTTIRSQRLLTEVPAGLTDTLEAIADFDGNGTDDLLVRTGADFTWSVYPVDGTTASSASSGATGIPQRAAMRLVAAADFDGDGQADILLRNANTLTWVLYRMKGAQVVSAAVVGALPPDPRWELQTVDDFDRDGRADLLLRQRDTGAWWTGFMDGAAVKTVSGSTDIPTARAWALQATADLNGDGFTDVLLSRHDTGAVYTTLLMGRARLDGSGTVALGSDPQRRVAGAADFDGDGFAEALTIDGSGRWGFATVAGRSAGATLTLPLPGAGQLRFACAPPAYHEFGAIEPPATSGSAWAFLGWSRPATRENGEALCRHELAGYRVQANRTGGAETRTVAIGDPATRWQLFERLTPGVWSFRVSALDENGRASRPAGPLTKTIP